MKHIRSVRAAALVAVFILAPLPTFAAQSRAKQLPLAAVTANSKHFPKGHRRHPAPRRILDADIPAAITNTALSASDRNVLLGAMKALKPEHRENVTILLPNGRLITNKPNNGSYVPRQVPGKPNVYLDNEGREFTVKQDRRPGTSYRPAQVASAPGVVHEIAAADPPDPTGGNTGPFHRVFSTNGYSAAKVDLELSCVSGNLRPSETGNVYIGGFGASTSFVDAGLYHGSDFVNADYFDLLLKEAHGGAYGGSSMVSTAERWDCSQTVTLEMYPSGIYINTTNGAVYDYLWLNITGFDIGGVFANHSYSVLSPQGEWNQDGSGDMIKRMTTIAQQNQDNADGSWWGYDPGPGQLLFHWLNTNIGVPGNYHPWTASDASFSSSQDWVGDPNGNALDPSTYIFQNMPTGDENVDSWEGIFLHP